MRRLLFGILFLISLAFASDPIVVQARTTWGIWLVEGTVNGQKAVFMVDSGANRTVVMPSPQLKEGERKVKIEIGDLKLDTKVVVYPLHLLSSLADEKTGTDAAPIMGVLGMDVMAKMAVGFDYSSGKVSFWTDGKLDAKVAQDWAMEGAKNSTPAKLDLSRRLDNRLAMPISMGSSKGWLMLDTGTTYTTLKPDFALTNPNSFLLFNTPIVLAAKTSDLELRIMREANFGAFRVPWLLYNKADTVSDVKGNPDGVFSLLDFRSSRALIDFAAAAVYFANPDRRDSGVLVLSRTSNVPFIYSDGELRVNLAGSQGFEWMKEADMQPVISIAGRPVKDILDALVGSREDSLTFMKDLCTAFQSDYTIEVNVNGKTLKCVVKVS